MSDALVENAAVLKRMSDDGDDLRRARGIEFAHVFVEEGRAREFCNWALRNGYVASLEDREDARIDVIVCNHMVPDLCTITEFEKMLGEAARDYEGESDGWGCITIPRRHS